MKIDKYIKDVSNRLDNISNNGNGSNQDDKKIDKYDDQYYLDIQSEPPCTTDKQDQMIVLLKTN